MRLINERIFKDKKAGEKILSLWWIVILILIGIGIVGGTLIFYSKDIDVKKIEAEILAEKVIGCFSDGFELNEEAVMGEIFDICSLDKERLEEDYFLKIQITGANFEEKKYGKFSFEKDCDIAENVLSAEHFPKCAEKSTDLKYNGKDIILNVKTGSNYDGE